MKNTKNLAYHKMLPGENAGFCRPLFYQGRHFKNTKGNDCFYAALLVVRGTCPADLDVTDAFFWRVTGKRFRRVTPHFMVQRYGYSSGYLAYPVKYNDFLGYFAVYLDFDDLGYVPQELGCRSCPNRTDCVYMRNGMREV